MKSLYRLFLCSLPLLYGATAAAQSASDTFLLNVCNQFWKTGEPVPGMLLSDSVATDTAGFCRPVLFSPASSVDGYCPFGYKNDDWRNGVTVADYLLVWKHILGLKPITSPCLMKAADVHASGHHSAFDQIDIRQLVLGVYDSFPLNTSWQFVPETYNFYTGACPGFDHHPDSTTGSLTLCAVKTGDLDGDVNLHGPYVIPPNSSLPLSVDGGLVSAGDTARLAVRLAADGQIAAMQFGIRLDTSRCSVLKVRGGDYPWYDVQYAAFPDAAHVAWVNPNVFPHPFSAGDVLLEIQVAAHQSFDPAQVIDLYQTIVPALWVDADDAVHPFTDSLVLTGSQAGKRTVLGELRFAVCTATTCDPKKEPISIEINVE